MGMELPNIPCQVVARTDVSRMISTDSHCSGNVETHLEITEVERSGKKHQHLFEGENMSEKLRSKKHEGKRKCLGVKLEMFSVPLPLLRADDETPKDWLTLPFTRSVYPFVYPCCYLASEPWGSYDNELLKGESSLAMKKTGNNFLLLIFLEYLVKPWESNFELIIYCSLFLPHLVLMFLMNSLTFIICFGPASWKAYDQPCIPKGH